ncbi:MAG: epoxyqueuosine reductase QueH [Patescibacteria group bacterium]|jgi:predicted adenine nucleotide alpha hydrolase (AANH) superfamily ATPase
MIINKLTKSLIALAWFLLVFQLVTLPMPHYPEAVEKITYGDKVVHFLLFGLLFYFIANAFIKKDFSKAPERQINPPLRQTSRQASPPLRRAGWRWAVYPAFFFSVFFSFFTEYLQIYIPGRTSSLLDTAAGVIGIVFFVWLFWKINAPKKPKLLLHICCVGCGAFTSRELGKEFQVVLYFSNSNISPKEEHDKRLEEAKKIAKKLKLKLITSPYRHKAWLKKVRGLEKEKERGKRCLVCYKARLKETARAAKKLGFEYFTSTLTISPHKDAKAIMSIGAELEKKHKVKFLARDFKENDGFRKSCVLSKELKLYRQNYCGCEFSIRPGKKG